MSAREWNLHLWLSRIYQNPFLSQPAPDYEETLQAAFRVNQTPTSLEKKALARHLDVPFKKVRSLVDVLHSPPCWFLGSCSLSFILP